VNNQIDYISVSISPVCEHLRSAMPACNVQGAHAILTTILSQCCKITAFTWTRHSNNDKYIYFWGFTYFNVDISSPMKQGDALPVKLAGCMSSWPYTEKNDFCCLFKSLN